MFHRSIAIVAALCFALTAGAQTRVITPEEHLGHPLGADFKLPDWKAVSAYYAALARQSDRVIVEKIGVSTEGRDFLMATISSRENLSRLEDIKRAAAVIADPRGSDEAAVRRALQIGKPIVMISLAMHANESAGTQFGMRLAHELATSEAEPFRWAREKCVVVMFPSSNPDGLDAVAHWYGRIVHTPYEAAGLLELYQKYTGHDNNRDWFMLTQAETRLITKQLYFNFRPQIYWDVHQQGTEKERFFVPPYRDPLNENLDPTILAATYALGQRAVLDLTREGFTGVSTGSTYDMWWNGGNRSVPVRHNIIGILTEAASVNLASPMFLKREQLKDPRGGKEYRPTNQLIHPWPGGWWRQRDIIEYEMGFARSLLASVAREPQLYLRTTLESARRAMESGRSGSPRAWVIPASSGDVEAVRRLSEALLLTGVELDVLTEAQRLDGRAYPAGSIVIRREQPYGQYVKDLFELQRFPDGEAPYDVAGWSLPLLMGVQRVEVRHEFAAKLARVTTHQEAVAGFGGAARPEGMARALPLGDSATWKALRQTVGRGTALHVSTRPGEGWLTSEAPPSGGEKPVVVRRLPRVGVYAPWTGDMDEGWLRWVLEYLGVGYVSLRPEAVRAGDLGGVVDVLIFAGTTARQIDAGRAAGTLPEEFAGGIGPEGAAAVDTFVRGGGTVIAIEDSATWAVEAMKLPVVEVTRGEKAKGFSCPGSVLRAQPAADHRLTRDLPPSVALFFSRSKAFEASSAARSGKSAKGEGDRVETLLRYAPTHLLMSGWIARPEAIEDAGAWLRVEHGQGRVHLFGFRPHYRAWSQGTFGMLMRAIYLDGAAVR